MTQLFLQADPESVSFPYLSRVLINAILASWSTSPNIGTPIAAIGIIYDLNAIAVLDSVRSSRQIRPRAR